MDLKYFILSLNFLHAGLYMVTASDDWAYSGDHGPTHWPGICTTGTKQSPINIVTADTVEADLDQLKFITYDQPVHAKVINNGHSVQVRLLNAALHLKGGNLSSTYTLDQMHFHWPAEHTVDDNRDALELHFVHYDARYENVTAASQHENGIAVVATLFQLSDEENLDLIPVIKETEVVSNWLEEKSGMISQVVPYLFLPNSHTYYRYEGSLTTPGCQESVIWYIFAEKLPISEEQINTFKHVKTSNGTLDFNYRPTQAIGERTVYKHLDEYSGATLLTPNFLYTPLSCMLIRVLYST
ncbi:carbonic anhydrase 1 isoform X2 [Andrena cerasifolii]|uniref:carbonic anhydrase 1 isoform X2 n=1 Tax=Andrena cerasifolii TaxID=2819439 RepID=UPI0040378345